MKKNIFIIILLVLLGMETGLLIFAHKTVGLYIPIAWDLTYEDTDFFEQIPHNLSISISNQTHKELFIDAVLDDKIRFGSSIIRDQHFGNAALCITTEAGEHTIQIKFPKQEASEKFKFRIEDSKPCYLLIHVSGNPGELKYKLKTQDTPFGIL